MKVLVIEDIDQIAGPIVRELRNEHGHDVTWARDPLEARTYEGYFDVVVVDLLFEHLNVEFDRRRVGRNVSLTRDQLLITGLTAIDDAIRRNDRIKFVVWTSAEANRRLHLLYASEESDIGAFCSKSSGTGRADVLNAAIIGAVEGRLYVDPVLSAYLTTGHGRSISQTILREPSHRAIWRAVALGAHSRGEIAKITGYESRTVGNRMPELLAKLLKLDPGIRPGRPLNEIVSYASRNWEFFLDNAVKLRYP
jgi:DNA-binding NarL/FixJ family response regulator